MATIMIRKYLHFSFTSCPTGHDRSCVYLRVLPIYLGGNGSGVTVSDLLDLCLGGDLGRGLLGGRGSGVLVWERRLLTLLPFASSLSLGLLFASSFSLC